TAWRFPSVIRAALGRARATYGRGTDCASSPAVRVARRACVPMSVVAGPARTELVDGAILAIIDRIQRTGREVEPDMSAGGVAEGSADELPVLAAAAPTPAAARPE